jgi:hypothetical protein
MSTHPFVIHAGVRTIASRVKTLEIEHMFFYSSTAAPVCFPAMAHRRGANPPPRVEFGGIHMFLGWYDPDRKRPAAQKLAEAVERYVEKFGDEPSLCLTSAADAAELDGKTELPVRAVTFISRYTYYVGVEDAPESELAAA